MKTKLPLRHTLEVFLLHADGTTERTIVGPFRRGQRVQLLIPGDTFHAAKLTGRRHARGHTEHRRA